MLIISTNFFHRKYKKDSCFPQEGLLSNFLIDTGYNVMLLMVFFYTLVCIYFIEDRIYIQELGHYQEEASFFERLKYR